MIKVRQIVPTIFFLIVEQAYLEIFLEIKRHIAACTMTENNDKKYLTFLRIARSTCVSKFLNKSKYLEMLFLLLLCFV